MNEIELKPCPFCGNEYPLIEHEYYTDTVKICCPHCQSEFSLDFTAGHNRDKDKLIKAWNRRLDDANRVELPHLPLELLGLSVKTYHCLKHTGMNTVKDVVNKLREGRTYIRNLREEGTREIVAKFKKYGVDIKIVKDSGRFCLEIDRKDDKNG